MGSGPRTVSLPLLLVLFAVLTGDKGVWVLGFGFKVFVCSTAVGVLHSFRLCLLVPACAVSFAKSMQSLQRLLRTPFSQPCRGLCANHQPRTRKGEFVSNTLLKVWVAAP